MKTKFQLVVILFALFFLNVSISHAQNSEESFHILGTVEGKGKSFEIIDSEYLNITVNSSEIIETRIKSVPKMISFNLKASDDVSSSEITIFGLPKNTTFHKYQDNYHNYAPLISNENGEVSFDIDLKGDHYIFIQPIKSTKYISTDTAKNNCSSIGIWDDSSKTCTLNADVSETIQIDSDDITLDGNGHTVSGSHSGSGIYIPGRRGVTIKNITVSNFSSGVNFYGCDNSKLENSIITKHQDGVHLENSTDITIKDNLIEFNGYGVNQNGNYSNLSNNIFEKNNIMANAFAGMALYQGSNDILKNNIVKNGPSDGIWISSKGKNDLSENIVEGNKERNFFIISNDMGLNEIDETNLVEGKPIKYIKNASDQTFDNSFGAGSFYCINCNNIEVKGLNLPIGGSRVLFWHTNNSSVEGVTSSDESGILTFYYSSLNKITKNTFKNIYFYYQSNGNQFYNNNVMATYSPATVSNSTGNLFNLDLPVGGNYWEKSKDICKNYNHNGICDNFFVINSSNKDYYPYLDKFNVESGEISGNSNILFLPGIKASKLYKDGNLGTEDQLWPPNYFGDDLEDLGLNENGESVNEVYARDVLESAGGNIYKTFIEKLKSLKNDKTINDYGLYAYDWRKSVEDIAQNGTLYDDGEMKSAITEIENLSNSAQNKKVTIVAHSNGGLLAKSIMMKLEESGKADKIDKIIFVGAPQMGTPLSILSLLYGYDESLIMGTLVSQSEARKFGENMPGAYGLLPTEKYFERMEEPFINFSSENTRYNIFKNAYEENIENFGEFQKFLIAKDDHREDPSDNDVELENVFDENILNSAIETHNRLDNWTPPVNVQVVEIAGWGLDTVSGINYKEKKKINCFTYPMPPSIPIPFCNESDDEYEPIYEPTFTVDGDEVVVTPSALMMEEGEKVKKFWVDLHGNNDKGEYIEHKNILEMVSAQQFVLDIIKNKNISILPTYISTSRPEDYIDAKPRIRMSLYSPLNIHLYDSEERHTGPKKVTDEKGNEGIVFEEEIPNSYYYQLGDRKYVGFPSGENIHIEMDGYAEGAYTLKMEEIKETEIGEEIASQITFKNLPVSANTKVTLNVPETGINNISNLETDYDGNGSNDYEIIPVPNGEAIMPDIYPPQSRIELSGAEGINDWYVSDVEISLSATDNEGGDGVESISYSINNGEWQNYLDPITISQERINNIQYFAIDKKGNKEEIKNEIIKIDKTAPEVKLIFNKDEQKLNTVGIDNLSQNVAVLVEKEIKEKTGIKGIFSHLFDIIKKGNKKRVSIATFVDEAGNRTELVFKKKYSNKHLINVIPLSISYNGAKNNFSKSFLQYEWMINKKKKNYSIFQSHIRTNDKFFESHYIEKKNETWIIERSLKGRPVIEKLPGMGIPYMQTEQGGININY